MYGLKLDDHGRILHVVTEAFIREEHISVECLPDGDAAEYLYVNGEYVRQPAQAELPEPTRLDTLEAQMTYTAMMTDTLLEV